jgi:SSS family solute:Na+ symporter
MPRLDLHPIDMVLILAYLVGVAAVGLWYSRGVKTGKDLFLAGRTLPWWAVGASLVMTDIGAKDMVGLAGEGYRYGLVMTNFDFIGCVFPVLVAAFLFMPYFWMAGVYTVPEYLGLRYNRAVRTVFAVVWGLAMIGTVGVILVSGAKLFTGLLQWNFWTSVVVLAAVVGVYTVAGGLKAVVYTDFVSCFVLIGGAVLICTRGLWEVGGWTGLREQVLAQSWAADHFKLILPADSPTPFPWTAVLLGLGFVQGPGYWIGNQAIVQRSFGTRSQNEARASYVLCAAVKLVFPFLLVVPGLIGIALFHRELGPPTGKFNANEVLPMLIGRLLPTGALGIVVGAFFAGVLSNLDSYLNSASAVWVTDVYRPWLRPKADDRECLRVGQALTVVLLVIGIGVSYLVNEVFDSVYEAFQTIMTLFQGPMFALLLLGMLTRRVNATGGTWGMGLGISTSVGLLLCGPVLGEPYSVPYLWVAWWSFVATVGTAWLTSYLAPPPDSERLRGLVFGTKRAEVSP